MASRPRAAIWYRPPQRRSQIVSRVSENLEKSYGTPRFGNPQDPVDDLVYVILSTKTSLSMARAVYKTLRKTFRTWEDLLGSPLPKLKRILRPAGLSNVKSKQIYQALQKIRSDFGACRLDSLRATSESDAQTYLTSLPGVSEKVAKCVMMYTLGFRVMPVDTHIYRVAHRLGWTAKKRPDQCHKELESLIPPRRRYAFHVSCMAHGQQVCRPSHPDCENCAI